MARASRKTPQQQRSQATVDAILDAAADLFSVHGLADTSTNAIAARAGVSIGSLYQYFPDKYSLLEALRERVVKGLWETVGRACEEGCTMPWPGALRSVVTECAGFHKTHLPLLAVLDAELPLHAPDMERMVMAQATFDQQLRKFLEAHQRSIKVSVDQALFIMPALARGVFSTASVERPDAVAREELVDAIMTVMLGYLT